MYEAPLFRKVSIVSKHRQRRGIGPKTGQNDVEEEEEQQQNSFVSINFLRRSA